MSDATAAVLIHRSLRPDTLLSTLQQDGYQVYPSYLEQDRSVLTLFNDTDLPEHLFLIVVVVVRHNVWSFSLTGPSNAGCKCRYHTVEYFGAS